MDDKPPTWLLERALDERRIAALATNRSAAEAHFALSERLFHAFRDYDIAVRLERYPPLAAVGD